MFRRKKRKKPSPKESALEYYYRTERKFRKFEGVEKGQRLKGQAS